MCRGSKSLSKFTYLPRFMRCCRCPGKGGEQDMDAMLELWRRLLPILCVVSSPVVSSPVAAASAAGSG